MFDNFWILGATGFRFSCPKVFTTNNRAFGKLNTFHLQNLKFYSKPLLKLASRKAQMIVVVRYKLLHVKHHAFTFSVSETIISLNVILTIKNLKKPKYIFDQFMSLKYSLRFDLSEELQHKNESFTIFSPFFSGTPSNFTSNIK